MSIIKIRDVAYPILQVPDLDAQERFLIDFGMERVLLEDDTLYMRGAGDQQFLHVTQKGEKKFIGLAFYAQSEEDLKTLSKLDNFSEIEELTSPGGGKKTWTTDPDDIRIEVVYGIKSRQPDIEKFLSPGDNVGGIRKENHSRFNQTKRVGKLVPSKIKKLGHIGINISDVAKSFEWYNHHFGILISDKIEIEKDLYGAMFCRCDLGEEPTDHHSIFIASNLTSAMISGLNHVSYEVIEIDDIFLGHESLKQNNYKHEWGIGRHYLGSQIFDYWRSPFGHVHEHMTDSDVFDNTVPAGTGSIEDAQGMQWGPDITSTFGNEEGV